MLSHDSQEQADNETARNIEWARARGTARALAQRLILYENNPDPMREREAPNPADSITRIRRIVPVIAGRVDIDQETRDHNTRVQNLGKQ